MSESYYSKSVWHDLDTQGCLNQGALGSKHPLGVQIKSDTWQGRPVWTLNSQYNPMK